jgi:hypothetical protein
VSGRGIKTDIPWDLFFYDPLLLTGSFPLSTDQLEILKNKGDLKIIPSTPARGSNKFYELWLKSNK